MSDNPIYSETVQTTTTMDPEIKAQWIKDLLSGEFKQGQGCLYNETEGTNCCWGVLEYRAPEDAKYLPGAAYPSPRLLEWAGIDRRSGPTGDIMLYLAELNDSDSSNWVWIAEEIDRWL